MTHGEQTAPKPRRHYASLTTRILFVNLLAPAILVIGLFYLGEYRNNLIATELSGMRTHGEIFSVALSESAVSPMRRMLVPDLSSQIVRRLAFTAKTRARLFAPNGKLVADSRTLLEPGGEVERKNLPPLSTLEERESLLNRAFAFMDRIYDWLPGTKEYPQYREKINQSAEDFPEVMAAMKGDVWVARRSMPDGSLVLTVAMPVRQYKETLGVILLSKGSLDIDNALYEVRLDILKMFAVVLVITVMLSLYLAGTIARPVHVLAQAAERVRRGHHRQHTIPDLGGRTDEIGELAVALSDMTEALWARMDAIESFAADVAHEIKNPLTSLKSAVETANRVDDPEQQKKLLAIILDDVERLDRLITDISDASRLDSELSRAETEPVDVSAMLATLVDMHSATANADMPKLELSSKDKLVVNATADRLVQVFRNLIANAISFSPAGADNAIRITAGVEGKWATVCFIDRGPGIAPGKEAAIFERFYTERPEAEKFGTHSGLGLAISRQIITAHGGQISAETLKDADGSVLGACFTVRLPLP